MGWPFEAMKNYRLVAALVTDPDTKKPVPLSRLYPRLEKMMSKKAAQGSGPATEDEVFEMLKAARSRK